MHFVHRSGNAVRLEARHGAGRPMRCRALSYTFALGGMPSAAVDDTDASMTWRANHEVRF